MSSITSANSVVTLSVAGLFPVPQQLQGYAADRAWESNAIAMTESVIGVDGKKSTGYIFNLVEQTFTLQADSNARRIFTDIINAQKQAREHYVISGTIDLPATGESFICVNGTLQTSKMLPDGGRVLSQMDYIIVWESINPTLS